MSKNQNDRYVECAHYIANRLIFDTNASTLPFCGYDYALVNRTEITRYPISWHVVMDSAYTELHATLKAQYKPPVHFDPKKYPRKLDSKLFMLKMRLCIQYDYLAIYRLNTQGQLCKIDWPTVLRLCDREMYRKIYEEDSLEG